MFGSEKVGVIEMETQRKQKVRKRKRRLPAFFKKYLMSS